MDEWHIEKWFVVCKSERTLCLSTTNMTKKRKHSAFDNVFWSRRYALKRKKNQFKRLWFFPRWCLLNFWIIEPKKCLEHFEIEIKTYFFSSWEFQVFKKKMIFFLALHFLCFINEIQDVDIWYICMIDGA